MMHLIQKTIEHIKEAVNNSPVLFVSLWIGMFLIVFAILFQFGWVPEALQEDYVGTTTTTLFEQEQVDKNSSSTGEVQQVLATETQQYAIIEEDSEFLPRRIISDSAGVDVTVRNPQSTDINILNSELQSGAVRYPGSGDLEDVSNMFIFGHSSYLPEVINRNYQAFNGIQNLEKGDVIRVQSATHEYVYMTETVELVDAGNAWVEFTTGEKMLTLSTCNVFGRKQDRYVVTAKFVGKYEL